MQNILDQSLTVTAKSKKHPYIHIIEIERKILFSSTEVATQGI